MKKKKRSHTILGKSSEPEDFDRVMETLLQHAHAPNPRLPIGPFETVAQRRKVSERHRRSKPRHAKVNLLS